MAIIKFQTISTPASPFKNINSPLFFSFFLILFLIWRGLPYGVFFCTWGPRSCVAFSYSSPSFFSPPPLFFFGEKNWKLHKFFYSMNSFFCRHSLSAICNRGDMNMMMTVHVLGWSCRILHVAIFVVVISLLISWSFDQMRVPMYRAFLVVHGIGQNRGSTSHCQLSIEGHFLLFQESLTKGYFLKSFFFPFFFFVVAPRSSRNLWKF